MTHLSLSKIGLQIAVFIGGFVPVIAGGYGVVRGVSFFLDNNTNISFDSHVRYLSGLLLGIGLLFWSLIPQIDSRTKEFRLLTCIVCIGGFARLFALVTQGVPSHAMMFGLGMELIVTPMLCVWQHTLRS